MSSKRRRFDCQPGTEVLNVDPPEPLATATGPISVLVYVRRPPCRLVDASGEELAIQPGQDRRAFRYSLIHRGGHWRLIDEQDLGDA